MRHCAHLSTHNAAFIASWAGLGRAWGGCPVGLAQAWWGKARDRPASLGVWP
jgi:hypothetical protein